MKPHPRSALATRIVAAGLLCLAPAPALLAIDKFWIDANGGSFGDIANWDNTEGGPGGDPVPGAGDIANFTLPDTYTVSFGAGATNTDLDVGDGNVTFDLNGFTYTLTNNSGTITVGDSAGQTGRLTVRDGTLGVDSSGDQVYLGLSSTGPGFLTISTGGRLGTAALRPEIFVGLNSAGTLTVNDNGRIDADILSLGVNNFSTAGTVTITGPNAMADFSGNTFIGANGAGTLTVSSGGTLVSGGQVSIGNSASADGSATVSGAGSSWTIASTTTIGALGQGTLAISSGGLVSSTSTATLGSSATGSGTVTVSGTNSRWEVSSSQTIGSTGVGVMNVFSGGQVSSFGATMGSSPGSEGRVTITGTGAQWALVSALTVGGSGAGDLMVSAGGEVSATSLTLGNFATGIGEATITGSGSKLTTGFSLTVANNGTGTLNVASGGEVHVGSSLTVNDPANAPIGTLNVDGGSVFVAGDFTSNGVFNFTDGLLRVTGSFQPNAAAGSFTLNGSDAGDLPTLELIGAGTTTNVTLLTVGHNQRGQLLLRQGRVLDLGAGSINIGGLVGGEGTVSVQGGAQLLTTGGLGVGGAGVTVGGTGTLNISGGTVDVAPLRLFREGTIHLSGGTLAVNSLPVLDGQFHWTGGTLRFDAAFSLTSTNVPALLGLDAALDAGQTLASTATVTLQTPLVVNGGALNASSFINQSRIEVRSGTVGAVQNNGLLFGDGTISGAVTNAATGRIRVDAGKTLAFTGAFSPNAGELNLQGGTLDFSGAVTNSAGAFIAGRGALYTGGLTNNGQMAFSGETMDIHGDVTNAAGARIVTSGAGTVTTFFDDVVHNGVEIFTGASASTVFFGDQSGAGNFTGTGTVYFIGDLRPGNSPASVTYGGDVALGGTSSLSVEIGGLIAGIHYDRLNIAGTLFEDGALDVVLYNGFTPDLGDSFDLFNAGAVIGSFDDVNLPDLGSGLEWDTTNLQRTGELRVVPEPGIGALLGSAFVLLGLRRRIRPLSPRAIVSAAPRLFHQASNLHVS